MGRLADRVTVVTGAARGIGRAVARAFAAEGATVYGVDVIEDELKQVFDALEEEGRSAFAFRANVSNPKEVEKLAVQVLARSDQVDCLANIAGIISYSPIEETSSDVWDRILNVNLRGTFLCARAFVPAMKAEGRGSIINVSSRAGAMGFKDLTAYCASKFGVEGLSRALSQELSPHGIAVNSITPGTPVHTAMSETTYGAEQRKTWKDPSIITPAFVHLAMQDPAGLNDRYVDAWALSEQLRAEGWS